MTGTTDDITPRLEGAPLAEARVLCVVIHGRYGAPESMMEHLVDHLTAPEVAYLLPRAAGQQWYLAPSCAPFTAETGAEIAAGLDRIDADIAAARAQAPDARLVVGGFSQGGCMAVEYAARHGAWDGALFALTGCRVGAVGAGRSLRDLGGLQAYLATGSGDPFIKLPEFAATAQAFAAAGARLRVDLFPRSDHVMSPPEIATVDTLLRRVAAGAPLFEGSAI